MISELVKSIFSWGSYLIIGAFMLFHRVDIAILPLFVVMSQYLLTSAFTIADSLIFKFYSDESFDRLGNLKKRESHSLDLSNEVSVEAIYKSFEEKNVLNGITLSIAKDSRVKLVGENGSGKTTLMMIFIGALNPDRGSVYQSGRKVGFLFQEDPILPLRGEELVDEVISTGECDRQELSRLISLFKMEEKMNHDLSSLSEGERKKFFLAITLSKDVDFLILDEPTNHVDSDSVEALTKELKASKSSLLVCTHDARLDSIGFDREIRLKDGKIYG